jgi:RNA polymerase sigma-70 factor, ECF subfamily
MLLSTAPPRATVTATMPVGPVRAAGHARSAGAAPQVLPPLRGHAGEPTLRWVIWAVVRGSSGIPRCVPADTRILVRPDDAAFQSRLAAARDGDDVAWIELYHELAPIIIGYLRAQRLPEAEDVAGDVLLEVVRDLHRFQGDADNLRSWALAITHHRLLDARRRTARRPQRAEGANETGELPADDDPASEALGRLGFGRLEPALKTLTDDQRTVLLLRVIGDLPIAEVARITGKRTGAVKQLQRRAVDAMRRHLDAVTASPGSGGGSNGEAVASPMAAAPAPEQPVPTETATATPRARRQDPAGHRRGGSRSRAAAAQPVTEPSLRTLSERDGRDDDGR